jgi:histone-lysine N-methyltransferase SETD2
MDKFRYKLPKEELKKFGKEVNKKLVSSDYKNNRVEDPTSITKKQEKKVKIYVKEFLDRAVQKYQEHEKKKVDRSTRDGSKTSQQLKINGHDTAMEIHANLDNGDIVMTDDEEPGATPASSDLKRKREDELVGSPELTPSETPSLKKLKENENDVPSPPPPPPPPPPEIEDTFDLAVVEQDNGLGEEDSVMFQHEQEEERQRLREEEAALERENELNMLEFQRGELKNEVASVMIH